MSNDNSRFDDIELRRSWDELHRDVVLRGRRLRVRRRALQAAPILVSVAIFAGAIAIVNRGPDQRTIVADGGDPSSSVTPAPTVPEPEVARIAFVRIRNGGADGSEIYIVDSDGENLRRLSRDAATNDGSPTFSPDGQRIAFQSERDNPLRGIKRVTDVYTMRADGTDIQRVTVTTAPGLGNGVRHPSWSPDGRLLAVAREDATDNSHILTMTPDGDNERRITDGPGDVGPVWSPDGEWIAFRRRPTNQDEQLWVVRPDGTEAQLVLAQIHDSPVAWSPDGRITFADQPSEGVRLFSVNLDGGDRRALTDGPGLKDVAPAWAPSGDWFVYAQDQDDAFFFERNIDGTETVGGGPRPGRLIIATPAGTLLALLTEPDQRDYDLPAAVTALR